MNIDTLELLNERLGQLHFEPTFYWTGDLEKDAILINQPHIDKEGLQEDRIKETLELMQLHIFKPTKFDGFDARDVLNIQNYFLKQNNYKGIVPGIRTHNIAFKNSVLFLDIPPLFDSILPVNLKTKEELLLWYTVMQKIHPLSDLNGRVFGVIVALLYQHYN